MCRLKWKLLIEAFILSAICLSVSEANVNISNYYHSPNASTTTTMHHFAINNESHGIWDEAASNLEAHDVKVSTSTVEAASVREQVLIDDDEWASSYAKHLERSSVIFGLTTVANESSMSNDCYWQLKLIQRSILRKQPWAMKVLDASGTKPSGFVFGQNFWLGSREACGAVQNPVAITLSKNFQRVMHDGLISDNAPFDMDYRVVYLRHNSPWQVEIKLMSEQIIHIGLCLPSACASNEIQQLTADYVELGMFVENDIYDIKPEVFYMKDLKLRESFYQKATFKIVIAAVIFTLAMMLCASLLRVKPILIAESKLQTELPEPQAESKDTVGVDQTPIEAAPGSINRTFKDLVQCYDVDKNCDKMFATRANVPNEIPVLNGLRSVCAIWILFFHVVWFMYFTVDNKTFLLSYAERVFFQYVSSAPLLVDVFFTISGFLQTYNFVRNSKQMNTIRQNSLAQNIKQFLKLLFHRYLRLGPLYLVVVGAVDLFHAYSGDVSVYHIDENYEQLCSQHWWRNLFFIQNFFKHADMCLNWSWSLACEMQFFIVATIMLFTYAKNPKLVKVLTIVGLIASASWTLGIGMNAKFELSFDSAYATGTYVYISPFVRIMPYIIGAITGWYLMEKQSQFDISDFKEKCLWNLSILIFFVCIYSTIKRDISILMSVLLFVFGRILFSLSVCWMIVGSATGRGSWWSRILEAKVFQHLNRLSYAIYLLNPFVIILFFSLTSTSTHADLFMLCVVMLGFAVICYLAAIVFSLAFEMPYYNLSSLLLKRNKQKSA